MMTKQSPPGPEVTFRMLICRADSLSRAGLGFFWEKDEQPLRPPGSVHSASVPNELALCPSPSNRVSEQNDLQELSHSGLDQLPESELVQSQVLAPQPRPPTPRRLIVGEAHKLAREFWDMIQLCASTDHSVCPAKVRGATQSALTAEVFWVLIDARYHRQGPEGDTDRHRSPNMPKGGHQPKSSQRPNQRSSSKIKSYPTGGSATQLWKLVKLVSSIKGTSSGPRSDKLQSAIRKAKTEWLGRVMRLKRLAVQAEKSGLLTLSNELIPRNSEAGGPVPQSACSRYPIGPLEGFVEDHLRRTRLRIDSLLKRAADRQATAFTTNFDSLVADIGAAAPSFVQPLTDPLASYLPSNQFQIEREYFEHLKAQKESELTKIHLGRLGSTSFKPLTDSCQICDSEDSLEDNLLVYCSVS